MKPKQLDTNGKKKPLEGERKQNTRTLPKDVLPPSPSYKPLPKEDQKKLDSNL